MKKVVCFLVVVALTTPLIGQTINFNVTDIGTSKLQIGYVNDPCDLVPSADLPVGIALKVVVTKGLIAAMDSYDNTEFSVYIDYAYGDPCAYGIGDGHPLAASESTPGALDPCSLPVSQLVICMGRLETGVPGPNPGPDSVANLATFTLEADPCDPCDYALVTVSAESSYRGGVVGGGEAFSTNLSVENVKVGLVIIPDCWKSPYGLTQCRGDYGGPGGLPNGKVDSTDFIALKSAYGSNYGDVKYNPCADSNRNGAIDSTDFIALKSNYGSDPTTADCAAGAPYGWPPSP